MKREVMPPRYWYLELVAIWAAAGALAYASAGCVEDELTKADVDNALVDCCVAFPEGLGLEGCVKDTLDTLDAWHHYNTDPYGCVPYTCPAGLGPVRWSTRACP